MNEGKKTLNELEAIALDSYDSTELFKAKVELTEMISTLYKSIHIAQYEDEKFELKSDLSKANALLEIVNDRKDEVMNKTNSHHYNFKQAAKLVLKRGKFNRIVELASISRSEIKKMADDLKLEKELYD